MLDRMGKIETGVRANGFTGAVVGFDWPSDGTVFAYNSDRSDAKKVAPCLVSDGMLPLLAMSPRPKVHILAHSMGGLVVLRGFSDFGDGAGGSKAWSADQVMFASADIEAHWLEKGAWGGLVLGKRSKRFTNYHSEKDRVLALSGGFINGFRARAGHEGIPALTERNHWDIHSDEQFMSDVPASKQNNRKYSHRWWFDSNGFFKDVALNMAGADAETMPTRKRTTNPDLVLDA